MIRRGDDRAPAMFFAAMAALLLLVNIVGFGPTYFFKPFRASPPVPVLIHLHGFVFLGWFVLFLIQSSLAASGRIALHRRLGRMSMLLVCAIPPLGVAVLVSLVRRERVPLIGDELYRVATIVWGNVAMLIAFSILIALAYLWRRQRDRHARLILLASIVLMPQALTRISRFPALGVNELAMLAAFVVLLLMLVLYDLIAIGRMHRVSLWGSALSLGALLLGAIVLPATGICRAAIGMLQQQIVL